MLHLRALYFIRGLIRSDNLCKCIAFFAEPTTRHMNRLSSASRAKDVGLLSTLEEASVQRELHFFDCSRFTHVVLS